MKSLAIGFDVDDVLFPWSRYAHEACERAGITNGAQITRWQFWEDYKCTAEALWEVINPAYREGMLLRSPIEGAVDALRALAAEGHTIHLVTARGVTEHSSVRALVRSDTKNWLHRFRVPYHSLTFTKDKTEVDTDYFVDDSVEHYDALHAAGRRVWLMDAQHNQWAKGTGRGRVFNVSHYVETIKFHESIRKNDTIAQVGNAALAYATVGRGV